MKHRTWKRWTAALAAAAILFTPLTTRAQTPEEPTVEVNHALNGTAQANDTELSWSASKAIDGVVNREETNQSRWSTNGAKTFDQVEQKDKVLMVNLGSVKSFDQLVLEWERTNITQFKIETAGADQNYTTFYEKADDAEITSLTTTIDQAGSAQYLRLTVSGYTPGTIDWASVSLYEFKVLENVPASEVPNDKPVVVPELAEWTGGHGDFTITDDTRLVVNPAHKDALNTAVTEFQADYKDVTGKTLTVVDGTQPQAGDFYFTLGSSDTDLGEEGYLLKVADGLTVEAVDAQGVYWGTRSILQILAQTGDTVPQGTARDYPAYEVRGFMLDVGRKPISYEFLQTILKEMAWYKMNDFQLHLNDNAFQKEYPNATVEIAKKAYSGFRLESTIKKGGLNQADLTSEDMYYTKDQMRTFIQEARALGIDVVPEIDTPAHSLALTKVRPDLIYAQTKEGVDHLNLHEKYQETLSFVQSIFNEYLTGTDPVFDAQTIVHVGTDEYDATYTEDFRQYTDDMLKFIQDTGRTVRLWGSLSMRSGETEVRSEGVQMNVWNTGWANPNDMIRDGYDIINTDDTMLYIVPGVTRPGLVGPYYHDYLDSQGLYNNWNPTKFGGNTTVPADSKQLLGATFAVWNDKSGVHSNGITEQDIYDRFADALPALASKMWGDGKDLTYQQLVAAVDEIGVAPNNNPLYEASSVDGQYLSYTFEDGQEQQDTTANNRDLVKLTNVETQYGTLKLLGGESYAATGLDKLGFGNALEFDITLSEQAKPGQILFEADSEYDTHDIRILEDGTLGYTTELYDYSFGYTLPVGETVHLRIESIREHSALIVGGVRHEAVGTYEEEAAQLSLTNIGYPSFVLPLQRIGSETNSVVGFIDNVTVSVIAASEEENHIASYSATSQQSDKPIANAFDGSTSTFWHSNWSSYDPLPISVTMNFDGPQTVTGFTYLPRQDNNSNGQVTKYDLEYKATADGDWIKLVTDGVWAANAQKKTAANFDPVQAVALRFTAKEGTGDNNNPAYACAAEFEVLFAEVGSNQLSMKAYVDSDQGGTATVSPETATVGQSVTFTAQPEEGYQFAGWYNLVGEKVSDEATYTVQADSGLTLIAKFQDGTEHTHTYGKPTFDWAEDGSSATATFACTQCDHEKTVDAEITSAVKTPATCTQMGTTTYTATVKSYTDTLDVQDIAMTDHHYENGVCVDCDAEDPNYVPPTENPDPDPTTSVDPQPSTPVDPQPSAPVTGGGVAVDNNTDNQITVGNADKVFEANTVITVESVTKGEIYNTVKEALKDVVADMKNTAILDITATLNGKPVQPSGKVQMTFAIPENLSVDNLKLFYVSDDGKTTEEIAITVDKDARTVTANLEHFSTYVLANVAVDEGGKVPPTGDNAPLMLSTLMLVGAGVCLAAVVAQKRKQRHS